VVDDGLEVEPGLPGRLKKVLEQSHADQVVVEMRPHEKLGGQVADGPALLFQQSLGGIDEQELHAVAQGRGHRQIVVVERDRQNGLAQLVEQLVGKGALELVDVAVAVSRGGDAARRAL